MTQENRDCNTEKQNTKREKTDLRKEEELGESVRMLSSFCRTKKQGVRAQLRGDRERFVANEKTEI